MVAAELSVVEALGALATSAANRRYVRPTDNMVAFLPSLDPLPADADPLIIDPSERNGEGPTAKSGDRKSVV